MKEGIERLNKRPSRHVSSDQTYGFSH